MDYFTRIEAIENALCELTGEQVYILFTQYHGLQLLDEGFYKYLVDEGVLPEEEEEEEEEDDWDHNYDPTEIDIAEMREW